MVVFHRDPMTDRLATLRNFHAVAYSMASADARQNAIHVTTLVAWPLPSARHDAIFLIQKSRVRLHGNKNPYSSLSPTHLLTSNPPSGLCHQKTATPRSDRVKREIIVVSAAGRKCFRIPFFVGGLFISLVHRSAPPPPADPPLRKHGRG